MRPRPLIASPPWTAGDDELLRSLLATEADRVWVLFDWDEAGFKNFLSDLEVPALIKEAGHVGKPPPAKFGGQYGPSRHRTRNRPGSWKESTVKALESGDQYQGTKLALIPVSGILGT
jgi:hypothetical protein